MKLLYDNNVKMDIHTMEGLQELVDESVREMEKQRKEAEKEDYLKYLHREGMTPETEQIIKHARDLKNKEIDEKYFQKIFKENVKLVKEMEEKEREKKIISERIEIKQQEYFKNNCKIQ